MPQRKPRAPSYAQRLDRVLDHIAENLAEDKLALATLSRVAGFSSFHFHRLFQAHTGETLHAHVRRVRVERAASLMRASRTRPLTDIALDVGFPALSDLSRAFKAQFGIAPSKWNRTVPLAASAQVAGKTHLELDDAELARRAKGVRVKVSELPRSLFVYTRVHDAYGNPNLVAAYNAARAWLDTIGRPQSDVVFAGMSLDDPAVTPKEKCRYDLGILFPFRATGVIADIARLRGVPLNVGPPSPAEVDRAGFSVRRFPELTLATVHCVGDLAAVDVTWQWLYRTYLPGQRRLPAKHPAMELFVKLPEHIGWEQFDLVACVPVL